MFDLTMKRRRIKLEICAEMADYLDQDYLLELLAEAGVKERKDLEEMDPPLSPVTVGWLSSRLAGPIPKRHSGFARVLERAHLESVAIRFAQAGRIDQLRGLVPLVSMACMEQIADALIAGKIDPDVEDLSDIYIFMPEGALKKLSDYMTSHGFPRESEVMKSYL